MIKFIKNQIKIIKQNDPSIKSNLEALLHVSLKVNVYYKIINFFYIKKLYFLSKIISNRLKRKTGVEISPGAVIGKNFFIDHGIGTVIGETSIIKDNVIIYHGVTLGAKKFNDKYRHPIIGNNVFIGAGSIILGRINIGDNVKIGAGSIVLKNVLDNSIITGIYK